MMARTELHRRKISQQGSDAVSDTEQKEALREAQRRLHMAEEKVEIVKKLIPIFHHAMAEYISHATPLADHLSGGDRQVAGEPGEDDRVARGLPRDGASDRPAIRGAGRLGSRDDLGPRRGLGRRRSRRPATRTRRRIRPAEEDAQPRSRPGRNVREQENPS